MSTAKIHKNSMAILIGGGLAAGLMNGLLGAGGGIVAVFVLGRLLRGNGIDSRDLFANALASMLPVTAVSLVSYALQGTVTLRGAEVLIIPAILGGVGGAFLLDRLKVETVQRIFTLLMIFSGIIMLVRG
jgi:uncharacterized membrane protein YfcA